MIYIKDGVRYPEKKLQRMQLINPLNDGYEILNTEKKPAINEFQKLVDSGNINIDGVWYIDWQAVSKSESEIAEINAKKLEEKRNALIERFESDLQANALDIASAIAEDGVNEATNVDALRADRSAIKTKFQSDMIALITGGLN